jgi:2-dehydro-3-deoxyphosphogluconate aldolase / (4S)-4-hydroxy-2-oxoglutarate aldolase
VLCASGIRAVEITLRTPVALAAIERIVAAALPLVVGAGSLLTAADQRRARDAGAAFGVSPGSSNALASAALRMNWPWLPGVATASEAMAMLARGFAVLKLFPASLEVLDALSGPLPSVKWVPTGGVNAQNAATYLSRPNVLAVSGTWIAPRALVADGRLDEVERRAVAAVRGSGPNART